MFSLSRWDLFSGGVHVPSRTRFYACAFPVRLDLSPFPLGLGWAQQVKLGKGFRMSCGPRGRDEEKNRRKVRQSESGPTGRGKCRRSPHYRKKNLIDRPAPRFKQQHPICTAGSGGWMAPVCLDRRPDCWGGLAAGSGGWRAPVCLDRRPDCWGGLAG